MNVKNLNFWGINIIGISCVVPKNELSITDDKELYNGNIEKINRLINSSGFLHRRITDNKTTTSDLCYMAAEDLLNNTNTDRKSIDGIIFVSYTPDYLMPATAYILQAKLGLPKDCIVQDIPQACSGYVIGLIQASMLINSGFNKILLLVGDSFSKFSDMFKNHSAPIFGDAGSATLIEKSAVKNSSFFNIYSDGNSHEALICRNGGFRNIVHEKDFYPDGTYKYNSSMNGGQIFDFAMEKVTPAIENLFNYSNTRKEDIDWFVMHQANKFILQNIARKLSIDVNKMPMQTLSKYGNQCGASIPCTICNELKNDISVKKSTLFLSGFGVGLNIANAIIKTDRIYCSDVIEF